MSYGVRKAVKGFKLDQEVVWNPIFGATDEFEDVFDIVF